MKRNIGKVDRLLRLGIGLLLMLGAIFWHSWILAIFALFTFYEVATSWCIFYQLIGRNTCPKK